MNENGVRFMQKSFYHIIFFIIIANQFLFAQLQEGGLPDEFFRWGIGGRALGMGRAYTALADDPTAAYWNPAGLADDALYFPKPGFFNHLNLSIFYSNLLADTKFCAFGISYQAFKKHTFGLNYLILSTGGVQGWSSNNTYIQRLDDFDFNKHALLLSWAYRIDSWPTLDVGMTTKYIWNWNSYSDHPSVSAYGGLDLGLRYRTKWQPLYFGINFQNFDDFILGKVHNLPVGGDRYRWAIRSGIGYFKSLSNFKLIVSLDHETMASYKFAWSHLRGGLEVRTYQDLIIARCGYNRNEFSLGFGFSLKKFGRPLLVDYAWGDFNYENLPSLSRGSVTWKGSTATDAQYFRMMIKLINNEDQRILFLHKVKEESYDTVLVKFAKTELDCIKISKHNKDNQDTWYKKLHEHIAANYKTNTIYNILVSQFPVTEPRMRCYFSVGWHLKQLDKKITIADLINDHQNTNKEAHADDQLSRESAFANPELGTNLLFYSGECFLESGDTKSAKIEFGKIRLFYPDIFSFKFKIETDGLLSKIEKEVLKPERKDDSKLSFPQDFNKDVGSQLYILDSGNKRIRKLKPEHINDISKSEKWKDPRSLIRFPSGIDIIKDDIFITDLRVPFLLKGNASDFTIVKLKMENILDRPFDIITYGKAPAIYFLIVESGKNRIIKYKLENGKYQKEEEISEGLYCPTKIAYDTSEKVLYVADWGHQRIVKFKEEDGKFKSSKLEFKKLEKNQPDALGFPIKLKILESKNNQNNGKKEKYLYVLYADLYGQKETNIVKYTIKKNSLIFSSSLDKLSPSTISFHPGKIEIDSNQNKNRKDVKYVSIQKFVILKGGQLGELEIKDLKE